MEQGRRQRVVALAAALFVVGYGTNVSTPFLILYQERLGLGTSATMAIFVVYVFGLVGTLFVAGPMSDIIGRRRIAVPFVAMSAVGSLIMIAGQDRFVFLLLGRFVLGVVSGAVLGVGSAWLLELTGRGGEMRAAVLTTLTTYAGFGLGPIISAAFERWTSSPLTFSFLVHAAVVALVLPPLARVPETVVRTDARRSFRVRFGVPPSARRSFALVIAPAAIWVFGFPSASFALFPVILSDAVGGSRVLVAGISGALTAWSALAARPILRIGPKRSLVVGMTFGTLGYLFGTVGFATGLWILLLPGAALLGAASGILTAASLTLLGEMADNATRGALTSTFYLLAYPGMAMPLLLTAVAGDGSLTAVLTGVTGLAVVMTTLVAIDVRLVGAPTGAESTVR